MTRQNANRRILELLESLVETHPDQRFMQLLFNADVLKTDESTSSDNGKPSVVNEYHIESVGLLERVRNSKIWEVT